MRSGIDGRGSDQAVRPQDDLFRHVNGGWLATAEIPPDRAVAGSFVTLVDEAEVHVRAIVEECQADPAGDPAGGSVNDEGAKIGALYASFMDVDRVEALEAAPLADDLAHVDEVRDLAAVVDALGRLERQAASGAFGMYVGPDPGAPERYVVTVVQGGLGLPDEAYYREEQFAAARTAYQAHVAIMLGLAGFDDADARAARVYGLEERLAKGHWDRVASRDAVETYNLLDLDALQALSPALDWHAWAAAARFDPAVLSEVVVSQPSYLQALSDALREEPVAAWQDWLRFRLVSAAAPYLSGPFVDANFDFYGKTLSGTDELRARWKRGVAFVEGAIGEGLGRLYVERHFPPTAAARMDALVANLVAAYRHSISTLPWMSDETKERALEKLDAFTPKVGFPKRWRDYAPLAADPADLLGNVRRASNVATDRELAKIGKPIDRDEWLMTPQTVNAYYNPTMNEIVFPAAILQPPFFDAEADDAVNYGGIGAVIGHEIGHGFDDQGSQYDGSGALRSWWTDADRAAFEKLTSSLIAQYDTLSPDGADGRTVNGALTIGENIGDLGGLGIAYQAYLLALDGQEPPVLDGLTGAQRFFISWAQCWRGKVRPAEVVRRLTIDPHSPPEFRTNQVVRNLDAFHDAFSVTSDDGMWLEPHQRVTIW
ncbi:peptidase M13 [Mumia sp. zg.B17]|uniref:M13 family metallopeptidase n=1 Tax=Mumia sp. zg.B17 TaxID=2855446 RepID=UPI001C6E4E6A|nr:M13-type metalloendopeptidase [Mumia sp. zg.B17]MBW9206478.1 peptidase M13 [Mumia sp. zg.B17]